MNPFTFIVELLGSVLAFFYSIIPNYGVAIILLTLTVSLLLFPLTLKQTRSMKALQVIQPEVKRLQKEHKGDKEEMQKQLMALYQEHGVNPAAGCLPLLLQMPIWFALFQVLRTTADNGSLTSSAIPADSRLADAIINHNTGFLGMNLLVSPNQALSDQASLQELAPPDAVVTAGFMTALPYIILVLIVVVAGIYQQMQMTRRSTAEQRAQQPQGMQTALKVMPLFFGFISWTFPSGLVLYFAVSNMFRIGQQALIFAMDGGRGQAGQTGGAAKPADPQPQSDSPSNPPPRKAAPNTSKKRRKRRRK